MSVVRVEESIEINRPLEEVFSFISNPETLSEWSGVAIEVRKDAPGPATVGDRFTLFQKFLGRKFESPCEVVTLEPNERYAYRSSGGPVPFTFTFVCESSTGGVRLTQTGEGDPGNFFRLVGPLFEKAGRRQMRHDLETLKDLLETKA